MRRHRIILTGGGTGGHIYPALAVAEVLKEDKNVEALLYVGARGRPEERLAAESNIQFFGLEVSGLPRTLSPRILKWTWQMWRAIGQSRKVVELFRPTAALGTGGYAAAAPLAACRWLAVPYGIHEPDAYPGLANRLLAAGASMVSLGNEAATGRLAHQATKIVVNGNPVRKSFLKPLGRDAACAVLGLDTALKTVMVTGGSQGAAGINEALAAALPGLLDLEPPLQVIHQAGEKNLQKIKERLPSAVLNNPRYLLRDYFADLSLPYAASDLVVCRAGAMTISELEVLGKPAIFIPFPYAAADHQRHNAEDLASRGAAAVLPQEKLSGRSLEESIRQLLTDKDRLSRMSKAMRSMARPCAAADLAAQIKELSTASQARKARAARVPDMRR